MKSFIFTITDPAGVHARPAGLLVKEVLKLDSKITIFSGDKSADATRLMAIMRLGIRFGTDITIRAEGGDEAKSIEILKSFLENNL